jgi:light-regulated signal transduction histidine kinase (bacteriophytochrome)
MPEMDGFELAKIIRTDERTKYVPIIFASANQQTESDIFKGYETGAVDYLMKPLNPAIVRSKVHIFAELLRKEIQQKKIEARLAEYAEELQRSNAELDQFASVVAHDLKAPLRTMRGYAEALVETEQRSMNAEAQGWLAKIAESSTRLSTMVDDLLMYSKVGKQHTIAELNATEILQEVMRDLSHAIEETKAKIEYPSLPTLFANATELRQLFQNLISNAIKYRRKDETPKLKIGVQQIEHFWNFSVQDNGIGIDPKFYVRLFKIFSRLNNAEIYPGTGIGLATCKKIVERHGGKIWLDSKPGEGSTFHFSIPTTPPEKDRR